MTLRRRVVPRRQGPASLCANDELAMAGYLDCWWRCEWMQTRRGWWAMAEQYGEEVYRRVLEYVPGTRPGFVYVLGELPPVPLVVEPDASHMDARRWLDVDGVRLWYAGPGFGHQQCQAQHLRAIGEVDGREWQRFKAWRRRGLPVEYVSAWSGDLGWLNHLCDWRA